MEIVYLYITFGFDLVGYCSFVLLFVVLLCSFVLWNFCATMIQTQAKCLRQNMLVLLFVICMHAWSAV